MSMLKKVLKVFNILKLFLVAPFYGATDVFYRNNLAAMLFYAHKILRLK